jgi:hypothetical protein
MQVPEFTITKPDGRMLTASALAVVLHDDSLLRRAAAHVFPVRLRPDGAPHALPVRPKAILLWSGDEYDAVGDYTQAQAEARAVEVLGDLGQAFAQ